jgi:hypothetical protein
MGSNDVDVTSVENLLALRAAVAPTDSALGAWNDLMSQVRFDHINPNTQRLAPSIFANLRRFSDFVERDRLRGAFKYTWSKTVRLIHSTQPLFDEFDRLNIDYRIIKGLAIQMLLNVPGSRTMGDVDVLVSQEDVDQVIIVLLQQGFRRTEHVVCSGHSLANHFAGLNFSKGETHIDIHVAGTKCPERLLAIMLNEAPMVGSFGAFQMKIPRPELLLLHAIVHGDLAAGPTDFVQGLVDANRLRGLVEHAVIKRVIKQSRIESHVSRFYRKATTGELSTLIFTPQDRYLRASRRFVMFFRRKPREKKQVSLLTRLNTRRIGRELVADRSSQHWMGRVLYRTWLFSGQVAMLEKLLLRYFGGMMKPPANILPAGLSAQPFLESGSHSAITALAVADRTIDWRLRIRLPDKTVRLQIQVSAPPLMNNDIWAFANGDVVSRLIGGDPSTHTLAIFHPSRDLEISIRPIWLACNRCFAGFNEMRLMFTLDQGG